MKQSRMVFVLITWVSIVMVQAIVLLAGQVRAEEVYGPLQPQRSISTVPDRTTEDEVTPKEVIEDRASTEEHILKSLPAKPDYTVLPLPVFAYNRNEKYWVGALMPILKTNLAGHVEDILAPQYSYNRYVGNGGSLSYFSYPSDTEQYHAIAWYSEKINRGLELGYKNVLAGGGRYILAADFGVFKDPFVRFFGIGDRTAESDETNYTSRELLTKLTAGININPDLLVMLTERIRLVRVDDGVVSSLPATKQVFPAVPGIQGADVLGHGLTIRYDTRDSQLIPIKGTYVNLLAEFNQNLHSSDENQWGNVVFDARHLMPHVSDRMVFVSRVYFKGVFGRTENAGPTRLGVPFYELSTLGGEDSLRAFGRGRFTDSYAVLANLEERIALPNMKIFDHDVQFEITPFLDMGRVGRAGINPGHLLFKDVQFNPGTGFRMLAKPKVVGRLDLAYGSDGANVFVGLDYPF